MADPHPVYPFLVRRYPTEFRHEYGEDLVALYGDLVADRGARAARASTALDLAITIPRYHLERLMTEQHTNTVLRVVIDLFAAGGVASFMTGVGPPGVILLALALVLAVTQRSALSRALRTPDSNLRRRRLLTAAALGGVFGLTYTIFTLTVGDSWTITDTLLALVGTLAMVACPLFLLAGLLVPRTPISDGLNGAL